MTFEEFLSYAKDPFVLLLIFVWSILGIVVYIELSKRIEKF